MQILYESLWISSSNCFLTALARGSWEPAFEAAASIKLNFFWKDWKMKRRCRSGDLEEDRYRKPLCKSLDVHQTRKRLVSASKRTNMIIDFELWIVAGFSSPIYFSVQLNSTSDPPPHANGKKNITQCSPDHHPISCLLVAKRECDGKCKFGLFKGRSSKFSSTLAFPASFYKGLEEFEADLDPKQIEKLLVFFEVISTQEKISKV